MKKNKLALVLALSNVLVLYANKSQAQIANTCHKADCGSFMHVVPKDHEHTFRCVNANCGSFQVFVTQNHKHTHRCESALCVSFTFFVPEDHKHIQKN